MIWVPHPGTPPWRMRARFTPNTKDVRLDADGAEFADLAAATRRGEGRLDAVAEGKPRDIMRMTFEGIPLPAVLVRPAADPETAVTLRVEDPGLVIHGGINRLDLLARDFDQLSKADDGAQLLAEWFPGHAYLNSTSLPATFTRAPDPTP